MIFIFLRTFFFFLVIKIINLITTRYTYSFKRLESCRIDSDHYWILGHCIILITDRVNGYHGIVRLIYSPFKHIREPEIAFYNFTSGFSYLIHLSKLYIQSHYRVINVCLI